MSIQDFGTQELDTRKTVETPDELDALGDYSVVLARKEFPDGTPAVLVIEKIAGLWYAAGFGSPVPPDMFTDAFFPAEVLFEL